MALIGVVTSYASNYIKTICNTGVLEEYVVVNIIDPDVCKEVCHHWSDDKYIKETMLNGYNIHVNLDDIEILN